MLKAIDVKIRIVTIMYDEWMNLLHSDAYSASTGVLLIQYKSINTSVSYSIRSCL